MPLKRYFYNEEHLKQNLLSLSFWAKHYPFSHSSSHSLQILSIFKTKINNHQLRKKQKNHKIMDIAQYIDINYLNYHLFQFQPFHSYTNSHFQHNFLLHKFPHLKKIPNSHTLNTYFHSSIQCINFHNNFHHTFVHNSLFKSLIYNHFCKQDIRNFCCILSNISSLAMVNPCIFNISLLLWILCYFHHKIHLLFYFFIYYIFNHYRIQKHILFHCNLIYYYLDIHHNQKNTFSKNCIYKYYLNSFQHSFFLNFKPNSKNCNHIQCNNSNYCISSNLMDTFNKQFYSFKIKITFLQK